MSPLTFKAHAGNGDFKSVPPGSHVAVCNLIADLGLQPGGDLYPEPRHQLYIRFEVPGERDKSTGPLVIGTFFTASMHEKASLRKQLEGWRGKKFSSNEEAEHFDVSSILGRACMLTVVETIKGSKVYSNVAAISSLPQGVAAPKAENQLLYYAEDKQDDFRLLPEWLQKKILSQFKQPEPEPISHIDRGLEISDDDIPF